MDPEAIASCLRNGWDVFLLADDSADIEGLCCYLESQGISRDVAILKDLGYPEEKIILGKTTILPEATGLYSIMIF